MFSAKYGLNGPFKRILGWFSLATESYFVLGVVIRRVERYDLVKIKPTESEAEHKGVYETTTATPRKTLIKKMNLYFTYESRDTIKSFTLFITDKTISKFNLKHSDGFEITIFKISSRRGSSSPENAAFGHFTLLGTTLP